MAYINPNLRAAQERAKQTKRRKPKVGASYQNYMKQATNPTTIKVDPIEEAVGIGTSGQVQQAVGDFGQATIQGMQQVGGATQFQPQTYAQTQPGQPANQSPTSSASATGAMGGATTQVDTTTQPNQPSFDYDAGATLPQTQPANLATTADQQLQNVLDVRRAKEAEQGVGTDLDGTSILKTAVDQTINREALGREFGYTDPTGQRGSGLIGSAEQVLLDRLQGGDNPLVRQQREDFLRRSEQEEDALMQRLSSLGVLRGGDTSEALGDFIGQRERTLNDIDASGYDMQTQALQGALGFQGRRDDLGLAEEGMRRQSLQDLASLASQKDARTIAEQDMQRSLRSEAYGRQSQLDDLATSEFSRNLAQRGDVRSEQALMGSEGRSERMLDSDLATAGLSRDIATSAEGRALGSENRQDRLAQQEILDRILGRDISGRQTDMQAERQARELGLAGSADQRAERALQSQLGLAGSADSRAERALQQDILGQSLARQATRAGMTGEFEGDTTQAARRQQAELGALSGAESRSERQLLSALGSQDLQDRIAQAGVTGMFEGEGSQRPQQSMALQALEAEQALRGDEFDLRRRLAEAEQTGRYAFGDQGDKYASRLGETTRSQQMLESDLESRDLQRRLAEAEQTGRFVFADSADARASAQGELTEDAEQRAFQRQLAEAGLTGTFDGEDTLQRQLAEGELLGEFDGETTLQRRLSEADRTGRLAMDQGEREEMMRGVSTQDYRDRYLDRQAVEAGMTGQFKGDDTMAERALGDQLRTSGLSRRLAEAEVTGELEGEGSQRARSTLSKKALDSDLSTQDLARRLSQAEATGKFYDPERRRDLDTMQRQQLDFERDQSRMGSLLSAIDVLDPEGGDAGALRTELGAVLNDSDFSNNLRRLLNTPGGTVDTSQQDTNSEILEILAGLQKNMQRLNRPSTRNSP